MNSLVSDVTLAIEDERQLKAHNITWVCANYINKSMLHGNKINDVTLACEGE